MDRRYPTFRTNYPSRLISLQDYVTIRQHELATRNPDRPMSRNASNSTLRNKKVAAATAATTTGGGGLASYPSFRVGDMAVASGSAAMSGAATAVAGTTPDDAASVRSLWSAVRCISLNYFASVSLSKAVAVISGH